MQHTDLYFVFGTAIFIILSSIAFNVAGGFTRPSGSYIFFNAVLTFIVGAVYKTWLGEPGESNLLNSHTTMMAYDVGMAGMLVAAYLSRRFAAKKGWLEDTLNQGNTQQAVYGCIAVAVMITVLPQVFSIDASNGTVFSALNQINRFMPMAILLGTVHQIRKSGGRSSISWAVAFGMIWEFTLGGILSFSKEGLIAPPVTWLLAAGSQRFRLSLYQVGAILLGGFLMVHYMIPYAQVGRNYRDQFTSLEQQFSITGDLLTHLGSIRDEYNSTEQDVYENQDVTFYHYYNNPQGLMDRLQMLAMDDALIDETEQGEPYGYYPVLFSVEAIVPHVFWPGKPVLNFGNIYAHEIGLLKADDTTTGISFSPSGESWHLGRWVGLTLLAPAIWFILFIVFDSVGGDARRSPWALLPIAIFAHTGPEGGISGLLYTLTYGIFGMLVVAFGCVYVLPHLGMLMTGPNRRAKLATGPSLRPIVQSPGAR